MTSYRTNLKVQQANSFYNYTVGLDVMDVDLVKTATNLLKSKIARTVCFSDLKCVYLDVDGCVQLEWLRPQGRQWDSHWEVKFSDNLPRHTAADLLFCLELSFLEQRIESPEARQMPSHLRAALPPLVLERDGLTLPIHPWLKLYSDGILIISFQLDAEWSGLDEGDFIQEIVNLFQQYFDRVWVQEHLQRIDAEQELLSDLGSKLSIGGQRVASRKTQKLVKKIRRDGRAVLEESLGKCGRAFDISGESWVLHQIAGSEGQSDWEATIDLCRSIYVRAVASLVTVSGRTWVGRAPQAQLWQGRPSISLMRFVDQPDSKEKLLEEFGPSISRVLGRHGELEDPPALPPDLRMFGDYCFHGDRALLLWTWLRTQDQPDNVWEEDNTQGRLLENQARAEHFEYHNLRIARACATASSPKSDEDLVEAYRVLAGAEAVIHHSGQAGEITDALDYLLAAAGTRGLIASGKEQARWHLDERRYRAERKRGRVDRWLTGVFGLVGVAGFADLVVKPLLTDMYPERGEAWTGLYAFALSFAVVGLVAVLIWIINILRR
ncbi:hypothetical protein [Halomonas faecis]|uniref:hypothetical protein n=1 Tax=Halomonas faecis TaxID=1562110 RepID=UPI0013D4D5DD|nr:hypothetical protein [Halomonas faecis]